MTTISKDSTAAPQKDNRRGLVVCQILGLAALALVIYSIMGSNYRILKYVVFAAAAVFVVIKPGFTPYAFILSFFTMQPVFTKGLMLSVHVTDVIFVFLFFVFICSKKIDINAALEKQRVLSISLSLFVLWAVFGYFVNFYNRTELENITSALFIFNFLEMAVMVILFSQPLWKEHREKFIFFYVICSFCEIVIAVTLELLDGAKTFADFHKFTGTLGPHHAMLGNAMVLSFGVASCAFFELRGKAERIFSLCVAFLSIATILLSGTRSAFLGMLLAIPIVILLLLRAKWSIPIVILSAIVLFTVVGMSTLKGIALHALLGSTSADSADMSSYGRLLIWERVYEYAMYAPWLQKIIGIGVGAFTSLKFDYYLEAGTFTTGAHNNFLHVFVESGIVGFIILGAVFIDIIRKLVLKSRCEDNASKCFLLCTLILLCSGITQETFWFNPSFGRFWFHYMFFYLIIFNFRDEERFVPRKEGKNEIAYRKAGL